MSHHCFVELVEVTPEEYALTPDLNDPEYATAMERFWAEIDPTGARRAVAEGAESIHIGPGKDDLAISYYEEPRPRDVGEEY